PGPAHHKILRRPPRQLFTISENFDRHKRSSPWSAVPWHRFGTKAPTSRRTPRRRSILKYRDDPERAAAAAFDLHRQCDHREALHRQLIKIRHVLKRRNVLLKQRPMALEERRLPIVDTRRV